MEEKPPVQTSFKSSLGNGIANASQLAAKSSERSSLKSSLSQDYMALGKELFTSGQHQADFANQFQQLQELTAKLSDVRQPVVQASDTYLDQAKVMAVKAKRFAEEKVLVHQLDNAFRRLGEAAFSKHGSFTGDGEIVKRIGEKTIQIDQLEADINQASGQLKDDLSKSFVAGTNATKNFFSKRPNQIAVVVLASILGLIVMKSGCGLISNTEDAAKQQITKSNEKNDGELKTYSVSKGLISGSITIEISKHEGVDLSSFTFKASGIYMKITPDSTFGEEFVIGRNTYKYTSYDKDGVKLSSSDVRHEQIGPGESVQGVIAIPGDTATRIRIHH